MHSRPIINQIIDRHPDEQFIIADGFDNAIIEYDENAMRIIYSYTKCIEILKQEMDEIDAIEHFNFNVAGAYVGERTPIFMTDDFE